MVQAPSWVQKLPFYSCCAGAYIVFLLLPILIAAYWLLLILFYGYDNVATRDQLNIRILEVPWVENCCSWWPVTHFVVFMVLGFLFPTCDILIIGAGILWELVEMCLAWAVGKSRQGMRIGVEHHLEYSTNWWAGSFKDIFANIFGFYIGKFYRITWNGIRQNLSSTPST